MKYAVLETGGKQYIAREGETIEVDRLQEDVGSKIQWDDVLLVVNDSDVAIGTPNVKGAQVKGTLVEQIKAPKILVFKYKSRERYRRRIGHRQRYSRVLIESISVTKPRTKKTETETKAAEVDTATSKKSPTKKTSGSKKTKASAKQASAKQTSGRKKSAKKASAKQTSGKSSTKKGSSAKSGSSKSTPKKPTSTKKKEPKE